MAAHAEFFGLGFGVLFSVCLVFFFFFIFWLWWCAVLLALVLFGSFVFSVVVSFGFCFWI